MEARDPAAATDRLNALLAEYRALYDIAILRMTALDRRVPVTAGAMAAVIAALDLVPGETQLLLLLSMPVALIWFVRATVNHARSFEDVLRRIEQIEAAVNCLLGASVMRFQSRHPSRSRHIGGRTSTETLSAVLATSLVVLVAAGFRMQRAQLLPRDLEVVYLIGLGLVGIVVLRDGIRLSAYRYQPVVDLSDSARQ